MPTINPKWTNRRIEPPKPSSTPRMVIIPSIPDRPDIVDIHARLDYQNRIEPQGRRRITSKLCPLYSITSKENLGSIWFSTKA